MNNRQQIWHRRAMLDRLRDVMAKIPIVELRLVLHAYEESGDHNHGQGSIPVGGACGSGDDCWVRRARAVIEAYEGAFPQSRGY